MSIDFIPSRKIQGKPTRKAVNSGVFQIIKPIRTKILPGFPSTKLNISLALKFFKKNPGSDQRLINWGEMAEYHVNNGIDDFALVRGLEQKGMKVIWHIREARARYSVTESLLQWFGCVTSFKLLLQKGSR